MIPKVIHYCWFGRNPLPDSAQKYIASWRKFFPDYEIKEWNEDNFDVGIIQYTREAYEAKKYAFVSDYARFWILYNYGGLYFDTDVEVIKSMDDIVTQGAFMGTELIDTDGFPNVNPGLGFGMDKGNTILESLLNKYARLHFKESDGSFNLRTIVDYTTEVLKENGLKPITGIQIVNSVCIYPTTYFNPFNDLTGRLACTEHTYSIHWYSKSWYYVPVWRLHISRLSHRLFGLKLHNTILRRKER